MRRTYKYEIQGTAANDQTWQTSGIVVDDHNDLNSVFDAVMRGSFASLTGGRAEYGKPGVGCAGPYGIGRIVIELEKT
jgi:hypothetical protein